MSAPSRNSVPSQNSLQSRIIVALDFASAEPCLKLVAQLDPSQVRLKVGKELFTRAGPDLVKTLVSKGFAVFLDLKFHDIPTTVAQAVKAAADLGVWMLNVHASGGSRMMTAARDALGDTDGRPKLIGVTVLTSMAAEDLAEIGIKAEPQTQVLHLAKLAQSSGLDGVVCSAQESSLLRQNLGDDFLLVTPGIRPAGSDAADQRRVVTPAEALAAGSDYLVIGRPITGADDPKAACDAIIATL